MGNEAESPDRSTHALNPASFLPHGRSLPAAEFHSLCPDGKGYTQDNNIVNYGIPAHRGKPRHGSAHRTRPAPPRPPRAVVLTGVGPAHTVIVCPAPITPSSASGKASPTEFAPPPR